MISAVIVNIIEILARISFNQRYETIDYTSVVRVQLRLTSSPSSFELIHIHFPSSTSKYVFRVLPSLLLSGVSCLRFDSLCPFDSIHQSLESLCRCFRRGKCLSCVVNSIGPVSASLSIQ